MEKKINKLKHDFMKNQEKVQFPYANNNIQHDKNERALSYNKK